VFVGLALAFFSFWHQTRFRQAVLYSWCVATFPHQSNNLAYRECTQ